MSTRLYPLYQKGGPQLRIFLPNFWLKLVRPKHEQPPNIVQFMCSIEMTKYDVKNYLEKIYGVKCVNVRTRIAMGETRQDPVKGYVIKDDDIKYAYVVLPKNETFEFPDIFAKEKENELEEEEEKTLEAAKKRHKQFLQKNSDRPGTPGWFSF